LIQASESELVQAAGLYIDGKFLGAVEKEEDLRGC
jgi:hypothetical protein